MRNIESHLPEKSVKSRFSRLKIQDSEERFLGNLESRNTQEMQCVGSVCVCVCVCVCFFFYSFGGAGVAYIYIYIVIYLLVCVLLCTNILGFYS